MARYVKQPHGGVLKIREKGDPSQSPGRPRVVQTLLKNEGYTLSQIQGVYKQIGALTEVEAAEILKDEKATMLEKILAQGVINSRKKGDLRTIESILDRAYGKVKDEVKVSVENPAEIPVLSKITNDPQEASIIYQQWIK